ncbi:MAG TPA: ComF family protein [Sedimentisphaerales bacterium]|nr:ComF family protein [Sedimentisphaerales bacterium]HRS11112.1 ComF family protein [Sedimentisphaerales bacterium]HRV47679.1 ComF family protein [Sedimentisphaerales bacterium]
MPSARIHSGFVQAKPLSRLAWQGLNQVLWPPVCLCCGQPAGPDNSGLCRACWDQLLAGTAGEYCPRCGRDASRYGLVHGACPACQAEDIQFDGIARAGVYNRTLRQMILAFKHDRTELEALLGMLADSAFQGSGFHKQIEMLVPVPLHWTRRLGRGYNQSHRIAKRLNHPTARICTDLVRTKRTKAQPAAATAAARRCNVKNAFAVRPDHRYAGKTVCLVDDIKTTGATLNECARTLKQAGAARVYALVLAVAGQDLS